MLSRVFPWNSFNFIWKSLKKTFHDFQNMFFNDWEICHPPPEIVSTSRLQRKHTRQLAQHDAVRARKETRFKNTAKAIICDRVLSMSQSDSGNRVAVCSDVIQVPSLRVRILKRRATECSSARNNCQNKKSFLAFMPGWISWIFRSHHITSCFFFLHDASLQEKQIDCLQFIVYIKSDFWYESAHASGRLSNHAIQVPSLRVPNLKTKKNIRAIHVALPMSFEEL